jgi:hypothetical protein
VCLADVDPTTPLLDTACWFYSTNAPGSEMAGDVDIPRCVWDGQWVLPDGKAYCIGVTVDGGVGNAAIDPDCAAQGRNAGFIVVGDVAAAIPPDYLLAFYCAFQVYPEPGGPSPDSLVPPPPLPPECSATSSGGSSGE